MQSGRLCLRRSPSRRLGESSDGVSRKLENGKRCESKPRRSGNLPVTMATLPVSRLPVVLLELSEVAISLISETDMVRIAVVEESGMR